MKTFFQVVTEGREGCNAQSMEFATLGDAVQELRRTWPADVIAELKARGESIFITEYTRTEEGYAKALKDYELEQLTTL